MAGNKNKGRNRNQTDWQDEMPQRDSDNQRQPTGEKGGEATDTERWEDSANRGEMDEFDTENL